MQIKILVDNNTIIDQYYVGEPAVSYLISDNKTKILFDVGYSDIFIKNAEKMNETLKDLNYIVLSHGHNDHTGGLPSLLKYFDCKVTNPKIITHPNTFLYKEEDGESIGITIDEKEINKKFATKLTKKPIWLSDNIIFLGEIERSNNFENKTPIGKYKLNNSLVDDYINDDSALVYKSSKGLVIITGCSHSGICNIIDYAIKVCQNDRIIDIVGGFHMLEPNETELKETLEYFKKLNIKNVHPCHCTSLDFKIKLANLNPVKDVGVGLVLDFE